MDSSIPTSSITYSNRDTSVDNGIPVQKTKDYGIGIDTHSRFIQVCVLTRKELHFYAHQKEFGTDWASLTAARDWCQKILETTADPLPDLSAPIHYCVESTSTYHMPVLLAFGGVPSIVNPAIAGATKRKTDVLDARLLATHDLIGVWRESYIPSPDIHTLRVLLWERDRCLAESTAASRRINNALVRFGLTTGRDGSVTKDGAVRDLVEAIVNGETDLPENLCPFGLPTEVREVILSEYHKYDTLRDLSEHWQNKAEEKVLSMEWETAYGTLSGKEMLDLLMSVPQVGRITAVIWLAHIITPKRFHNSKAVAAYCGLDPGLKVSAGHVVSTKKRGGSRQLHKALVSSADRLIRNHTEMFGRWGYNLYTQTGKWKKAANAVARKLAVAMYHIMLTGQPFTYENYNLIQNMDILDIPVTELPSIEPDFKRYIRILQEQGIRTTSDLAAAYLSCRLNSCKGLGRKFFSVLRIFLNQQKRYRKLYHELHAQTNPSNPSAGTENITPDQPQTIPNDPKEILNHEQKQPSE